MIHQIFKNLKAGLLFKSIIIKKLFTSLFYKLKIRLIFIKMGPKKDDKKKAQGGAGAAGAGPTVTISEDELAEARTLPRINDFVFMNLCAFKMTRNQSRLHKIVSK